MEQKVSAGLGGIPETMLWTLHYRAVEAMRPDGALVDPKAIEIYRAIDYDYERNFGRPQASLAVRSKAFDEEIEAFIIEHPDAIIVNLGEGLETQRFRVEAPGALWMTVDLPEAIAIRERFIQPDDDHVHLPLSALDRQWLEEVPEGRPVIVTAQGLFMYLKENEVRSLLRDIVTSFDECRVVFDTIPRWFSRKTRSRRGLRMTRHYRTPRMPWGINRDDIVATLGRWLGTGIVAEDIGYPDFPRGLERLFTSLWFNGPYLRNYSPTIVRLS